MIFVVTAAFIALDILSGIIKAIIGKSWNSSIMREGLYHKMGFVLFVVLAVLCDFGQRFLDIGFSIPITSGVCTYVILTEIGSIIENIALINPELVPEKIKAIFIKVSEK